MGTGELLDRRLPLESYTTEMILLWEWKQGRMVAQFEAEPYAASTGRRTRDGKIARRCTTSITCSTISTCSAAATSAGPKRL